MINSLVLLLLLFGLDLLSDRNLRAKYESSAADDVDSFIIYNNIHWLSLTCNFDDGFQTINSKGAFLSNQKSVNESDHHQWVDAIHENIKMMELMTWLVQISVKMVTG